MRYRRPSWRLAERPSCWSREDIEYLQRPLRWWEILGGSLLVAGGGLLSAAVMYAMLWGGALVAIAAGFEP